jgi:hypothetical protein
MDNAYHIDNVIILNKFIKLDKNIIIDSNTNILIDFYNVYCNYIKFNKYNTFTNTSFKTLLKHICEHFKNCKNVIIVSKEIYESEGEDYIIDTLKHFENITYYIIKDKDKKNSGKNRERDEIYLLYKFFLYLNDSKKSFILSNDKFKNYNSIINNIKPIEILKINSQETNVIYIDSFDLISIKQILLTKTKESINKIACEFGLGA